MKILFVNLSGLRFTVATPELEPLGGTESALCYLARQLAANGHEVAVATHLPPETPETVLKVQHYPATILGNRDFFAAQNFDAIIVNNTPLAGPSLRDIAPHARILLWLHVVPDHPVMAALAHQLVQDSFDSFIYVSRWQQQQMQQFFGFNKASVVIGNGFAPAFENLFTSADDLRAAKENRAAYTTTPFRGLPVLLDAMRGLKADTKLDLYSSMKVYQKTGGDDQFAPLYAYAAENPNIAHYGAVAQKELAERLKPVAFFTYPSTYAETFCIAGLEAVAAGMKVLTTASAALPEVLQQNGDYVAVWVGDAPKLTSDFRAMMERNVAAFLNDQQAWAEERFAALQQVNRTATWAERAKVWESLLLTKNV